MSAENGNKMIEWVTPEEKELVKKFRERVADVIPAEELSRPEDDQTAFLLRWIRARELNLDKAEALLKTTLQWRKDKKVEEALSRELDPFMIEKYRWKFVGADLGGRAVLVWNLYEWDLRMVASNKADQFEYFLQYVFESISKDIRYCNENRKPNQGPITQFSPILDCKGFAYGQLLNFTAMRKWFQAASIYEQFYPEILHRGIFINCPSFFPMFITMLKPFICPRTLSKLTCYSSAADWKKDIGKFVDPALIPEQYGGTCKTNPWDRNSNKG